MDSALKEIHKNMLRMGLGALAHANWHAHYYSIENDMWSELSVLQAAHAAEILIKARIAQEHPLLIFEQIPKVDLADNSVLSFERLLSGGRTYQYRDLPDRLWATTGIRLSNLEDYREFGKLRNAVQHFVPPANINLSQRTLEFTFGVVDQFINSNWGLFAIDSNEDHEPYEYFVPGILARGIRFLVSPESVEGMKYMEVEWPDDPAYQQEMEKRIEAVRNEVPKNGGR